MTLSLYNTLTRRKETFHPIDRNNVRMYVCGPTVYDLAHIGNARPIIVFDVLFRLLRHIYGPDHVTYARNITDVDDKINARAVERFPDLPPTEAIRKLTEETTAQFHKDIGALGVLEPTVEPRATDHIAEMRTICDALVRNGHAYVAEDHVLFAVNSMPDYGKFAHRSLEEMEAGARVDVAPYKKGPMDFVLWKLSKPGEPAWPSPGGIAAPGRPGWHIECSAMAEKHLGQVFDIHGGGIDLVFPHHENEIAQSRCAHGTDVMANYWMHNGFLQVEGEKMSKSLGNFVTIRELLDTTQFGGRRWAGEVLRLAMLKTHYREPINWSVDRLEGAERELLGWINSFKYDNSDEFVMRLHTNQWEMDSEVLTLLESDLNTPGVVARLHMLASEARGGNADAGRILAYTLALLGCFRPALLNAYDRSSVGASTSAYFASKYHHAVYEARTVVLNRYAVHLTEPAQRKATLAAVTAEINGLFSEMAADGVFFALAEDGDVSLMSSKADDRVDLLITARLAARKAKNFAESDRIRDELAAMGIQLKDVKDPATGEIKTEWEVKR